MVVEYIPLLNCYYMKINDELTCYTLINEKKMGKNHMVLFVNFKTRAILSKTNGARIPDMPTNLSFSSQKWLLAIVKMVILGQKWTTPLKCTPNENLSDLYDLKFQVLE